MSDDQIPRLTKHTVGIVPNCEICGNGYAATVKTACFTLRVCIQCQRDWDDEVCKLPEMLKHHKALFDVFAIRDAIIGGTCHTVGQAKTEVRIVVQEECDAQIELRAALRTLLKSMQDAKKPLDT